jgi:outer membrane protein TolC
LLPLAELQDLAVKQNPLLRASEARGQAQQARLSLAQKGSKPDIDLSIQYGQRDYRPDMISAVVSLPIPLHRGSRQQQEILEARSDLVATEADRRAQINSVRAQVAKLVSDIERERTELALYVKAILPQGSAAASASLASYQAGRSDLLSVLDNQSTLFTYQTAYYRALADFAKSLADLEQVVGGEVLR